MFKALVQWWQQRRQFSETVKEGERIIKQAERDSDLMVAAETQRADQELMPSVLPLLSPEERKDCLAELARTFAELYDGHLTEEKYSPEAKEAAWSRLTEAERKLLRTREGYVQMLPRLWPVLSEEEKRSFILSLPKGVLAWLLGSLPKEFVEQLYDEVFPEQPF